MTAATSNCQDFDSGFDRLVLRSCSCMWKTHERLQRACVVILFLVENSSRIAL